MNISSLPGSLFLESKLWADFNGSTPDYGPLADATFYGEDLGAVEVSEDVAGLIAGTLTGTEANTVLDRLLRNATDVLVHEAVDVTLQAVVAHLPHDVVRVLPWTPVSNGPTGDVPQTFWEKIGAAATPAVNVLLVAGQLIYVAGQLIYDGLVALGTFLVDLAQAIVDWGMKAAGEVQAAAQAAVQKAADVLASLVDLFVSAVRAALDALLAPVEAWGSSVVAAAQDVVQAALAFDGSDAALGDLAEALGALILAVFDPGITLALSVAALAIQAAILAAFLTGVGAVVATLVVPLIIATVISLVLAAVAPAIEALLGWIADLVVQQGWLWAGMGVAILTLSAVLLSRVSAPVETYKLTWSPPEAWWATGFDAELVSEQVPNKSGKAIMYAMLSLLVAGAALAADAAGESPFVSLVIDVFAVAFGALSTRSAVEGWDKYIFGKVTLVLSGTSLGHASASFVGHLNTAASGG